MMRDLSVPATPRDQRRFAIIAISRKLGCEFAAERHTGTPRDVDMLVSSSFVSMPYEAVVWR